jgi:hypothetical protein
MTSPKADQAPRPALSLSRQKEFIVENASNLSRSNKCSILSLVMLELEGAAVREAQNEVDINLDECEKLNPDIIPMIYNIVYTRLEILNTPLGAPTPRS